MSSERLDNGAELTPSERRELLARLLRARAGRSQLSFSQERLWFLHQLVQVPSLPDQLLLNYGFFKGGELVSQRQTVFINKIRVVNIHQTFFIIGNIHDQL